ENAGGSAMTDNDTVNRDDQLDEVLAAYLEAVESGWAPDRQRLLSCYPYLADDLARDFLNHDRLEDVTLPLRCVSGGTLSPSSVTMADTSPVSQNPRWPRVPGYLILEA